MDATIEANLVDVHHSEVDAYESGTTELTLLDAANFNLDC